MDICIPHRTTDLVHDIETHTIGMVSDLDVVKIRIRDLFLMQLPRKKEALDLQFSRRGENPNTYYIALMTGLHAVQLETGEYRIERMFGPESKTDAFPLGEARPIGDPNDASSWTMLSLTSPSKLDQFPAFTSDNIQLFYPGQVMEIAYHGKR